MAVSLVIRGMSELHLQMMKERVHKRDKVEMVSHAPKIPYRETVAGHAEGFYRHKKQSGGTGQFGRVKVKLTPGERGAGIVFKDSIADITLQQVLTRPSEFEVIATLNLNGDYLSDALAAQVGGIGIAPGGNINYLTGHAIFEATHGTAPKYANQDKVNPGSVVLSGEMMFRYMGWTEVADERAETRDETMFRARGRTGTPLSTGVPATVSICWIGGVVIHHLATHHGEHGLEAADLLGGHSQVVAREHGEVGQLANLDGVAVVDQEQEHVAVARQKHPHGSALFELFFERFGEIENNILFKNTIYADRTQIRAAMPGVDHHERQVFAMKRGRQSDRGATCGAG